MTRLQGGLPPVIFPLALVFAVSAAHAEEPEVLTLEQAIRIAEDRTRDVIVARQNLLLADVEKMRALSVILPRVDLTLNAGEIFAGKPIVEQRGGNFAEQELARLQGLPIPPPRVGPFQDLQTNSYSNPQFRLELRGRQLIYDGGRWWTVIAQADDAKKQQEETLRGLENDARSAATRRFYEMEKARRSVETFEQQIKVDQDQLLRVKALLDAGLGKQNDVAAVERNLARDRIELARRSYTERVARRALNLALGRAADTPLKLQVPPEVAVEDADVTNLRLPEKPALIDAAREKRPELAAARMGLEVAKKNVTIARADYWPVISLDANYSRQSRKPARIFDDPTENYYAGLGLALNWNLFNGRATNAAVQRAEIELNRSTTDYENLDRNIAAEVEDRRENVALLLEVHTLARQAMRAAEEAVRLARGLYEQGRGTLLELRDAELQLTLARLAVIEARLDLEIAREELRRAVGTDLASDSAAARVGGPT